VVGAQQLGGELPAVGRQPPSYGFWWGIGIGIGAGGRSGEVAGEDGSVSAHHAGDVEHGAVGLTAAAVLVGENLPGSVGVCTEPGDAQIGAQRSGFLSCGRIVSTARARPGRSVR
jgi:hypothetical protein